MNIELYQPHPKQLEIANHQARFKVVSCGRRFGKTVFAINELLLNALTESDSLYWYVAPTYRQAKTIAWQMLVRNYFKLPQDLRRGKNEQELWIQVGNNSRIELRGADNEDSLRGSGLNGLVIDEVASMRDFNYLWQEVLRPALTDKKGWGVFISTPKGFNHFYDLYQNCYKDNDYASFHFTSYENPYLPKDEIDKARIELTEDRFAQEYLADFRKTEGLVYKEFVRSKHIFSGDYKDAMQGQIKVFGGVDPGFTNPCAAMTIRKDKDAKYFVSAEWYKKGQTDVAIADYVSALQWNETYPDPESPGFIEELKKRQVNVREVIKGKDSIKNGINIVRELFKSNRLFIHDSCRNLINELETYRYPEKRLDRNEEENPIKENDHALDALRYALMMEPNSYIITNQSQSTPIIPYYGDKDMPF